MNKKGQGLSTTAIILIAIGVVIAVLLIAGFSGTFGSLANIINIFKPSDNIDNLVINCNLAMTQPSAFCEYKYVKLDGNSQYVNCVDSRIFSRLSSGAPATCTTDEKAYCIKLKKEGKDITRTDVNQKKCVDIMTQKDAECKSNEECSGNLKCDGYKPGNATTTEVLGKCA